MDSVSWLTGRIFSAGMLNTFSLSISYAVACFFSQLVGAGGVREAFCFGALLVIHCKITSLVTSCMV